MRAGWVTLVLAVPAGASAQVAPQPPVTEVTLVSLPGARPTRAGRFALSVSIGPAGFRAGFSGATGSASVTGAAAVGSVRASLWVSDSIAVQVGAAGGVAVAPQMSTDVPNLQLESAAGFTLVGGGLVIGARGQGLRVSLLGGVAWSWAVFGSRAANRGGAEPGGGAFVEVSHHWPLGAGWSLGLGATGWGFAGGGTWLDGTRPEESGSTHWSHFGGGLLATVATR